MKAILTSYLGGSYKIDGKRLPGPILRELPVESSTRKFKSENQYEETA